MGEATGGGRGHCSRCLTGGLHLSVTRREGEGGVQLVARGRRGARVGSTLVGPACPSGPWVRTEGAGLEQARRPKGVRGKEEILFFFLNKIFKGIFK